MAYNNAFPVNYQQYYPQMPVNQNNVQPQNNGIIWVQGEAGAKSYLVAPNTTVQLWDSESQVIYLKSSDASGMPSMKIIDYTIRNESQPQPICNDNYATLTDFNSLKDELESLKHELNKLKSKKVKSND